MHAIRIVYRVRVIGGELRDEVDGSTDTCGWFTLDEAARLNLGGLAQHALSLAAAETGGPRRHRPMRRPQTRRRTDRCAARSRIDVAAPPALVFALARDVDRWERLLPHYARSRALERRAGRLARRRLRRAPAVRSASSGSGSRSPGGRGPGTSRRRAASGSSTSPARPRGWTSPGGSSRRGRLARLDRPRLPAAPAALRRVRRSRASPGRSPAGRWPRSRPSPRRSRTSPNRRADSESIEP